MPTPVADEASTQVIGDASRSVNPGELQVSILLEAQRNICSRLTLIESAVDQLRQVCQTDNEIMRKALRVLQAEIDGIKATLHGGAPPRRCHECCRVVPTSGVACPGCGQKL